MRPSARAAVLLALLVAPAFAGCATPGAVDAAELARPRIGDRVEYDVGGHLVEFSRWANGFRLSGSSPRLAIEVDAVDGLALDGFRARHEVVRVREELATGGAFATHRDLLVSTTHAAIVQGYAPLSGEDGVVSFDERGYPWAWGASLFHGRPLAVGLVVEASLPANGGQPAPLPLVFEVTAAERVGGRDAFRVDVTRARGDASWSIWLAPDVPYPVQVEVALPRDAWSPFVRLDDPVTERLEFSATLASYVVGSTPVPPATASAEWLEEPTAAVFEEWDREVPPDGLGEYAPFLLHEAVTWAKTVDPGFSRWFTQHAGAILYRATYLARPGDVPGATTHVWLVQYVSKENEYYEVQVERTVPNAAAGVPGLTRIATSGVAEPPRGEHGWFDTALLPSRILAIDSAVTIMRDVFEPDGVQIFVRSFDDPAGYSYYVDGGFEEELGRYTVIINAQTGFIQAAVGPRAPVVE